MQFIKKQTFLLQVTQEFVSVIQVTQDSHTVLYCGDTCMIFSSLPCFYGNRWVLLNLVCTIKSNIKVQDTDI